MTTARTYTIHLRLKGKSLEWSYYKDKEDFWSPVTETSPFLLLKRQDHVDWVAGDGVKDITIDIKDKPSRVFDSISGSPTRCGCNIKQTMKAGDLDAYSISVNGGSLVVDPKGGSDDPPT